VSVDEERDDCGPALFQPEFVKIRLPRQSAPGSNVATVDTPFGINWNRLTLRGLERFAASKPGESQTWDAKQNPQERNRQGITREEALKAMIWKAGSAFANERGGFLILGAAERPDGTFALDGVDLPRRIKEPHDWVASAVRKLDPPPAFDVKSFPVRDRSLLVIRFDELPVKPCMTPDGRAYRRLGPQSAPADHATTVRWGRSADQHRHRAERRVKATLKELAEQTWASPTNTFVAAATFVVVAAIPGLDLGTGISLEDVRKQLVDFEAELPIRGEGPRKGASGISQHAALAGSDAGENEGWTVGFESGVASAAYWHPWLRSALLPGEEAHQDWRWPKRTREQFVAAALRAVESALSAGTGVSSIDMRRDLVAGLSIPTRGRIRRRRDKPDAWPVVLAVRWKRVGSASVFARETLEELSRVGHRPFNGYPPLKRVTMSLNEFVSQSKRG
jgi:hypothetical protein